MALRKPAENEAILVQGTLWVVEKLVTHGVLSCPLKKPKPPKIRWQKQVAAYLVRLQNSV